MSYQGVRAALAASVAIYAVAAASPVCAQTRSFNVPAQSAATAIPELARQADIQILVSESAVRGKTTRAVKGRMSVERALDRLLAGTGLKVATSDGRTFTLAVVAAPARSQSRTQASPGAGKAETASSSREDVVSGGQEIVVVGTHIRGAQPTSPVVTITQEEMRLSGQNNLGEVIRALPQNFSGGQNPEVAVGATTGSSMGNQNLTGSSALNLRGLGSDATLTLLNGTRLSYDGFGQAVDVSIIPVAAIERMEILLDGGSAIYGSDAIGGVANIVLKRDYEGAEIRARFGAATDGGYEQQQYTVVGGTNWGSGGFLVTGDYSDSGSVRAKQRDYLSHITNQNVAIYPQETRKGALFSGHQEIGALAEFRLDAYYAERSSEQLAQTSASLFFLVDRNSSNWSVAPSLEVALPRDWSARLHGVLGRNEAVVGQSGFSVATGLQTFESLSEYSNDMQAAGIELEGPLFALPGGDARASIGGGWRQNGFTQSNLVTGATTTEGKERSYHVYGEANLPLVSKEQDIPLIRRLSLNAALRHEEYDSFGSATTPKIGAIWGPVSGFDVKASWGRSFKVPTLLQQHRTISLQLRNAAQLGAVGAPAGAQALFFSVGGNPDLVPETAEIVTIGFVAKPEFLPAFTLEFGWFDIDYIDRVDQPINAASQALSDPIFAEFITLNPTVAELNAAFAAAGLPVGTFTNNFAGVPYNPANVFAIVDNRFTNVARQRVKGLDLVARYRTDIFGGDLSLSGNGSWITKGTRRLSDLAGEQPTAGVNFWPAKFRGRLRAAWSREGFTLNTNLNHTAGIIDRGVTPNVRRSSMTTVDLIVDYQANLSVVGDVGLNLAVTNLFNQAPPFLASPIASLAAFLVNYDSTNYSALGRVVSATVTKRF